MDTFMLIGITGIGLGALYFLVASGLSLIYGLMGVLNFAHGSFLTVGAFVGLWFSTQVVHVSNTWTFIAAMIVGGLASGLFALIVERVVITRLYERHIDQALVTSGKYPGFAAESATDFPAIIVPHKNILEIII